MYKMLEWTTYTLFAITIGMCVIGVLQNNFELAWEYPCYLAEKGILLGLGASVIPLWMSDPKRGGPEPITAEEVRLAWRIALTGLVVTGVLCALALGFDVNPITSEQASAFEFEPMVLGFMNVGSLIAASVLHSVLHTRQHRAQELEARSAADQDPADQTTDG